MSNAIKCIVRQGWTTRDADGNLIERRDYVYVTNEDGTPHIYASIAEARADIRGNYGRDANRAGILQTRSVDDYTGHVHDGYVYIVREDADEFAAATADAKAEAAAAEAIAAATAAALQAAEKAEQAKAEATRKGYAEKTAGYIVAELMDAYVKATGMTWSEYVETHDDEQAQALYRVASVEIIPEPERPAGYETASPEDYAAVATVVSVIATDALEQVATDAMNAANVAMGEASDALSKAEAAALEYDADAAAAFAAETRAAADKAEQAAEKAAAAATTPAACTLADIASEDAASARAYADRATETAEPRPTYQRAELLAYLGEPDDYDVTAIEHDATAYDPATGRTVWAVDADELAAIAERHQLQFYAPAF